MESGVPSWPVKHNWRYIARDTPPKRPASERACDFDEIYGLFDEATARAQASLRPDLVVRAVRDSRKAAAGIHKYLSSQTQA